MCEEINSLQTLKEVREFINAGYRLGQRGIPLPLAVANPGPLIERVVRISGSQGITLQEVRGVFSQLGGERLEEGLSFARGAGLIREEREKRPNRAGRSQEQVVLYPG